MTRIIHALLAVLALCLTPACSTLPNGDSTEGTTFNLNTQKLVVQVATLQYIGDDVEKAERVRGIVGDLISLDLQGVTAPIPLMVELAEGEIDWNRLTPTEELIVRELIRTAEDALVRKLNSINPGLTESELSEVARLDISKLLNWINDAALMQLMGTRAEDGRLKLNAAPPAESLSVRTVRRQDLVGHIFNLQEPAPVTPKSPKEIYNARKLNALMHSTDPDTGIVDGETYRALAPE